LRHGRRSAVHPHLAVYLHCVLRTRNDSASDLTFAGRQTRSLLSPATPGKEPTASCYVG
jgi:hypothetical protein